MSMIRTATALMFALAAFATPAIAQSVPAENLTSAAVINVDGMTITPRGDLETRYPKLSPREIDLLMFRIANAQ
jgi:hypothetical protein